MLSKQQLNSYWMPFTANRDYKEAPRLVASASGMYYRDQNGREILDGTAGLWCVPLGHSHPTVVKAVQDAVATLDYAPAFQIGHPQAFELAEQLIDYSGHKFGQVFYTNSGSEAVDTAMKMVLAYHRSRGEAQRTRFISRERAYHGVGFGGMSLGGLPANRKQFGTLLAGVDYLPHTHNLEKNAFTRGLPEYGTHLADELERLIALHDISTIAAVIVEPLAGSAGVILPSKGYLKRLRELCDKHGILLIFDEVITGFGRMGTPFASDFFGVTPDFMTTAKGLTNGVVPMGAVFSHQKIYDALMEGPAGIELFHGYTYSGHPLAVAASLASLKVFKEEKVLEHAQSMTAYWEDGLHSLKGLPHVIDLRNVGLIGAIELESMPGKVGARAMAAYKKAFAEGVLVRTTGDIIAMSPPLILEKKHVDQLFGKLHDILKHLD
ncbi:aspartate aminotransferase family protein [Undibacterium pigrum]|jgi:beta-alanine--pyruvate transaminase|uniref:Beta-alanine--pyruvate transaminase n=1 Tax=Undibacterium pigrum TaxID=401470 RepID=A0A318J3L1_9BURK|nr:aspartate aminotransferase family protein [Undibacterium pigrum]PXX43206.1 beta-alanine--pyruvate transaminase [Undibacterium pigrum]